MTLGLQELVLHFQGKKTAAYLAWPPCTAVCQISPPPTLTALAVGIVYGLAATGVGQVIKQAGEKD